MNNLPTCKYVLVLFFFLCLLSRRGWCADNPNAAPDKITVEWCMGGGAGQVTKMPFYAWLSTGKLFLYDSRNRQTPPEFTLLDPGKNTRIPALDYGKAMASLEELLEKDLRPAVIPAPHVLHPGGQYAVYRFNGDLFLLNLPQSRFTRLTHTPEEELCPKFSPDGQKAAYVRGNNLYVYFFDGAVEMAVTHDGSPTILNGNVCDMYKEDIFSEDDLAFWWSPDSQRLAFMQSDISAIGVIYYPDNSTFFPRQRAQRYTIAGGPIARVKIGIAGINRESPASPPDWVQLPIPEADYYIISAIWLPDAQKIAIRALNRAQTAVDLFFAQRSGGPCAHILTEKDEAWVNTDDDLHFLRKGGGFILGSERTGYKHLYRYNMAGKLMNPATRGEWQVRGPFQTSFWSGRAVVFIDEKNSLLYFTGLEKSAQERHLYRVGLNGKGMKRLSREDGFHSPVFSSDGQYYVEIYSNSHTPPRLSLHRADGARIRDLATSDTTTLARLNLAFPTMFAIPAADGFPLTARILKPAGCEPGKKFPAIIHIYGGPSAPMVLDRWNPAIYFYQILRNQGYIIFSVDIRSARAMGKKYENLILNRMHSASELEDLLAAVKWLKAQPFVDKERLGIWGWSYGGCFTLNAMMRTHEFKAGIAGAAVSDLRFHSPKWAEFSMKLPHANPAAYEDASLLKDAKNLHGRLLLVHGADDDNVRVQNLMRLTEELVNAGKQFDIMIYPQQKHGFDATAQIHLTHKMLEFWKLYL